MTSVDGHIAEQQVAASLGQHLDFYRRKRPTYQTTMLNSLAALWAGPHERLLDIGGGTGVVGQCVQDLFPVREVTSVDVEDRFCSGLTIAVRTYDGQRLPFEDNSFDAAMLNNVVHHIPVDVRENLFREIRRVVWGPVYIKDHVALSRVDHLLLAALDLIGNIPFGGMLKADYLDADQWKTLAERTGYVIAAELSARYRGEPMSWLFPNRLEATMRWEPC